MQTISSDLIRAARRRPLTIEAEPIRRGVWNRQRSFLIALGAVFAAAALVFALPLLGSA